MKVKLEFLKCMGIMLANLCHPYILSTTVLSDMLHGDHAVIFSMVHAAQMLQCAVGHNSLQNCLHCR